MTPEQKLAELINCNTPEQAASSGFPLAFLDYELAERHGVLALIESNLANFKRNHRSDLITDQAIVDRLKRHSYHCTASEMQRRAELGHTLGLINQYKPILLKGVVMAHVYYPDPQLRPMVDVDLVIPRDAIESVKSILLANGFLLLNNAFNNSVLAQFSCVKQLGKANSLHLDIHSNLFNRPSMQELLPFGLLIESAENVAIAESYALVPSSTYCLVHACLHIIQHQNDWRLIWLYDIKLLIDKLTKSDIVQVLDYSDTFRIAKILLTIIDICDENFPLESKQLRLKLLAQSNQQTSNPHPATGLLNDHSQLAILTLDWKTIKGIKNRLSWLKGHFFPERQYIEQKYATTFLPMVWVFYVWRIIKGTVKLFTRT